MDQMISALMDRFEDFKNPEFEISGVKFKISKLPPMKGFKMAEEIRFNLAKSANQIEVDGSSDEKSAALFFKAILSLPVEFIERLQKELFKHFEFQGSGVDKGWMILSGAEDMAFQDFEIINIYEALARGLIINFSGSFSGMLSVFQSAAQNTAPQS